MKIIILFIILILANCEARRPNVVILLADDLGIGDIGCFGNYSIKTPHIDRLAAEGMKLTHHLTAATMCTPSRAALLTGRYPARFGFLGAETGPPVLYHVASSASLPQSEITIAEAFQAANYTTGAVGKWHLGSDCNLFGRFCPGPLNHGFSFFYGLLHTLTAELTVPDHFWKFNLSETFYQSWLSIFIITIISLPFCSARKHWGLAIFLLIVSIVLLSTSWFCYTHLRLHTTGWCGASSWFYQNFNAVTVKNGIVMKQTLNLDGLSQRMTEQSVHFIEQESNKSNPFFLYHSFLHTHTPMFTTKENVGKSLCGRYGDNIEEMDEQVGIIWKALADNNVADSTIIYFASDHGGNLAIIDPVTKQRVGGHNKEFKGGKAMGGQEGGVRVPGIVKWSGHIPPNTSLDVPTSLMDLMPTLLQLVDLPPVQELVPHSNKLDGISYSDMLLDPDYKPTDRRVILHHCRQALHAVRLITEHKVYKMHLAWPRWKENSTQCGWGNVKCGCYGGDIFNLTENPRLFELISDPLEDHPIDNSTNEYNLIVSELKTFIQEWKKDVIYPPPLFEDWRNVIWLPWRQPLCIGCW